MYGFLKGPGFVVVWLTLYGYKYESFFEFPTQDLDSEQMNALDESLAFVGLNHMGYLPTYLKVFYDAVLWDKKAVVANYGGVWGILGKD